jgi:predicted RNA-binding Zn-ribbon protein involved in translation (DUF1610 family)
MSWRPADGERRQSYCPDCGTRGEPSTVSFTPATRTITYKCRACGLEWIIRTVPANALAGERN